MLENIVKRITREILRMVTLIRLVWILNAMRVPLIYRVQLKSDAAIIP